MPNSVGHHVAAASQAAQDPRIRAFSTVTRPQPAHQGAAEGASAFEPIVMARKPLVGTVAANVTAWGTGAINVDPTTGGRSRTRQ